MISITTLKRLTLVSLILTGVSVWGQEFRTQDDCKARYQAGGCTSRSDQNVQKWIVESPTCAAYYPAPPAGSPPPANQRTVVPSIPNCMTIGPISSSMSLGEAQQKCREEAKDRYCSQFPSSSESSRCDGLYQRVNDAGRSIGQQCSKEGLGNESSCTSTISQCSGVQNLNGTREDSTYGLMNVLGALGQSQSGGQFAGCVDQSDNSVEQQKNQLEKQIFDLKKEINKSIGDKAKKKGEISKKNTEIEKDKIKAQQEADKIKVQNQKDLAQKKAAIDKLVLELKSKQFGRLIEINKTSRELANAQFKIQQFMIQFADKQVQTKCGSDADAMAQAKRSGIPPKGAPSGTKPTPKKLTKKDQQEIDLAYQTCLQVSALAKKAELKKVQDEQAAARDKIALLQQSNQQDADAIESQKIEFEEAKKIAQQEEKNADDVKLRTDANLDKSLAEFKTQIEEELRGIEQENQGRMEQIASIMLQQQKIKPKYSTLPGLIEDRNRASQTFRDSCCRTGQEPNCGGSEDSYGTGGNGIN